MIRLLTSAKRVIRDSRTTGVAAVFPVFVAALLIMAASCGRSYAAQVAMTSPVPVLWQDATNLAGPWQDIAESASVQTLADGTRFFRGKLMHGQITLSCDPLPTVAITNATLWNGPEAGLYVELCDFGPTNKFNVVSCTIYPTNHFAATFTDCRGNISDFSSDREIMFTNRLHIKLVTPIP